MRQYVQIKHAIEHSSADQPQPTGPMADLVYRTMDEVEMDAIREGIETWRRKGNQHEMDVLTKRLTAFEAKFAEKWLKPKKPAARKRK